jgi:hypothetical protein
VIKANYYPGWDSNSDGLGLSREWGDEDGSDMTGLAFAGWGIADGMGFAVGRNGD